VTGAELAADDRHMARVHIDNAGEYAPDDSDWALVLAQLATAHATLALVEQQRIANLIAWYGDEDIPDAVADQIREGLGL